MLNKLFVVYGADIKTSKQINKTPPEENSLLDLIQMLGSRLTFSKYLSRISRPQLAHTFFPVDGTELLVEVGEHTEGVDGVLGDERVSSRSMLDRWDSPSE